MGSGILIRPGSLLHRSRRRRSGDTGRQRGANHPEVARALTLGPYTDVASYHAFTPITPYNTHQSEYELGPELQKNLLEDLACRHGPKLGNVPPKGLQDSLDMG